MIFGKYAGTDVKLDGEDYVILREDDILAIIVEGQVSDELARSSSSTQAAPREAILRGVNTAGQRGQGHARAPGRNVVLEKSFGSPVVTKDGVTVAKEIELEDKFENMGAQMVKEVASKTSDVAGDGTTTATVLAQAIFREGLKMVAAGHTPSSSSAASTRPSRASSTSSSELSKPPREDSQRDRSGRHRSPRTTTRRSATSSPTPWRRSARRA